MKIKKLTSVLTMSMMASFSTFSATFPPLRHEAPVVQVDTVRQIASGVSIIPDPRINYVPNIGIIEGKDAILVVDTGMGQENGQRVYEMAKKIAKGRKIYLTTTHFHPEHSFGASAFPKENFIINKLQADELADKGKTFVELFRSFGQVERDALKEVKISKPGMVYSGRTELDLGGRKVTLLEAPAHTRGDQLVYDSSTGVVFTGDLVEERFFPIMPDKDTNGSHWIKVTDEILALKPRVVVPGHGEIGTADLVKDVRSYLWQVREAVYVRVELGQSQEVITEALLPALKALHPDWDNNVFIPYEIAVFYAERRRSPLILPDLSSNLQSDAMSASP